MNKISLYFLLILIYLGLSKSFAPSEQGTSYIVNEHALQHFFSSSPVSVILTDSFKKGLIIHTYFQRYKVIHVFKPPEDIFVRTSEKFWTKHLDHIGMSILRRGEKSGNPTTTPLPPGFLFINDPAYGSWEYHDSGQKVWQFHNAYKKFPNLLGWSNFLATKDFYQSGLLYLKNDRAYFGLNNEFGAKGEITQEVYNWSPPNENTFKDSLHNFWGLVKNSFSLESLPSQKNNASLKKEEKASQNFPTSTPQKKTQFKKVGPQLGERPEKNKQNKNDQKTIFPNLPLREKVNE